MGLKLLDSVLHAFYSLLYVTMKGVKLMNYKIEVQEVGKYIEYLKKFKKDLERDIGFYIQKLPQFEKPIKIHFHWQEGTKRRDLDNIAAGKKFILDAMVKAGKLKDDNRRFVTAFTDTFSYGDTTKVILTIEEITE